MNVDSAAVSEYKRAAEGGDRYAPGNLAYALAQAGYLDEADEWVKVGQENENPPELVATAAAAIAKVRERDAERRAALVTQGDEVRGLVSGLAGVAISVVPEGAWVIDGVELEFEPTTDGTRAETGEDKTLTVVELTEHGALLRFVRRVGAFLPDEAKGYAVANKDTLRGLTWKPTGEAVKLIEGHRR